MDSLLLHHRPSPVASPQLSHKRPCCSTVSGLIPNFTTFSSDVVVESFLGLSDTSIDFSFDRIVNSKGSDLEQNDIIKRALRLGSALVEAGRRSARSRASMHNAVVWALPSDLTIKVFSLLDTQSVCYAAAACSFFKSCAADPACYANIDLITVFPRVNNATVATMVHRAGKGLRSLKLGCVPCPLASSSGSSQPMVNCIRKSTDAAGFSWNDKRSRQGKECSILTRNCLAPLNAYGGIPGKLRASLRRLHLYNIERMDNTALNTALSVCPSLLDLEIVGLHVELSPTLESVNTYCPLIERLFFESSKTGGDDSLKMQTCNDLVNNCPHLSSLALRGFKLQDFKARILIKGLHKLRYIDFSTSYSITGTFLKNLGGSSGGGLLEVLLLRDCTHLKIVEVARFLSAVLAGDFRNLKYLDISNREGLVSEDRYRRCCCPSFIPMERLSNERPELCVLAEFPLEGSFNEAEQVESSVDTEINSTSHLSSLSSGSSSFMSSSDSSSSSDPGSSNENSSFMHEESSDEVDNNSV